MKTPAAGVKTPLFDRIFKPTTITLENGHQVQKPHSRTPFIAAAVLLALWWSVRVTGFDLSIIVKRGHQFTKILGQTDMAYLARCAVNTPANTEKTKKAIKKALQKQMNGEGFCLIDVLSMCPTNWKMSEVDACEYIKTTQSKYLPLGEFIDRGGDK